MAAQNLPAKVLSELDPVKLAQVEAETAAHNAHDNMQPSPAQAEGVASANGKKSFHLKSIEELLSKKVSREWIIKPLIPRRGIGQIYGGSGSGKSFLAIDITCRVASTPEGDRGEWFGFKTTHCPVVYLALEGEDGIRNRFDACIRHHGYRVEDLLDVLIFSEEQFDIRKPEDLQALVDVVPSGALVIIDTMVQSSPGADQNSSADMSTIMDNAKALHKAIDGFVMLVAHTGKDESLGAAGWQGQKNNCDVQLQVERSFSLRSWHARKVKDDRDDYAGNFNLEVVNLGIDDDGDAITSCAVEKSDDVIVESSRKLSKGVALALSTFIETAKETDSKYVHESDWRAHFHAKKGNTNDDPQKSKQAKDKAFARARDTLLEMNKVFQTTDGTLFSLVPFPKDEY